MISFESDLSPGDVLLSALWFTLVIVWLLLVVRMFSDIFRSPDLSGIARAAWIIFVMVTPYLGVFAYLVVRGRKMVQNDLRLAGEQGESFRAYVQAAAGSTGAASVVSELERLAALRDRGTIDEVVFAALKTRLVSPLPGGDLEDRGIAPSPAS